MDKKLWLLIILVFIGFWNIEADEVTFEVEVNGIKINDGIVYGAIYSSDNSYKRHQPNFKFQSNAINETIKFNLNVISGEYVLKYIKTAIITGSLILVCLVFPKSRLE